MNLWVAFLQDDLDAFRNILANATQASQKSHAGGGVHMNTGLGFANATPGAGLGSSPRSTTKGRKSSAFSGNISSSKGVPVNVTRSDINYRDHSGLTILHRAASSTAQNSGCFALALLEHPLVDLYLQDYENGWTALHRALYFGNITVARAILQKDSNNGMKAGSLIKIKDNEGNTAFDVYNSIIARRFPSHKPRLQDPVYSDSESDDSVLSEVEERVPVTTSAGGDELFVFGSNKNFTLGLGDNDDRKHPERVVLKRPDHLIRRFFNEYLESRTAVDESNKQESASSRISYVPVDEIPILIRSRPIVIQDVVLSKLHSAFITTDPESNLYMCGFGPGGRLGTGDEVTRFEYVCIESGGLAGKKVVALGLGLNHSMAVSEEGMLYSWGSNGHGQLGYTLPRPSLKDDEPVQNVPRQIFGPLKRDFIRGVACSDIHSVAFTSTSLYTWGKNDGQLGLMDSDSRSLEIQTAPRKVAASLFSSPIKMVSAINRATICLLENHSVCVFTSYGYSFVKFPVGEAFSNYFLKDVAHTTRYEAEPDHITSVTCGGETIAAVSSRGDLFTLNINHKLDPSHPSSATSTTNPSKIKSALSQPQRIWQLRKGNWDGIKSVDVGENGTVILSTNAGAVWHRVKRPKIRDAYASNLMEYKAKDYKFERIPGLTNISTVKSNAFGGCAAIRKDCDVLHTQVKVAERALWDDIAPLLSIRGLEASEVKDEDTESPRFWIPALPSEHLQPMKRAILASPDLEADVSRHLRIKGPVGKEYDVELSTTLSNVRVPVHCFMLAGRSTVFQQAWCQYQKCGYYSFPEVLEIVPTENRKANVKFLGIDFITLLNIVVYLYDDTVVDVWQFTKHSPRDAFRYRSCRTELMKVALRLDMKNLEAAVRLQVEPARQLHADLDLAIKNPRYLEGGDTIVVLDGAEELAHSAILCQRCPFFQGLFNGRSEGMWLANRRMDASELVRVDLGHVDPSAFKIVLRYLYSDAGIEIFDEIKAADLDEFSEIVLSVMAVADELMLDRLSQICQQMLGRFVNTRNVCHLINAIAPCACTEFKNAGLEYVCLQLESMLESRLLDDLDEDLLLELEEVVRSNQLACMPFARSGKAEKMLHERYPGLRADLDEEKQRRINDMAFRSHLKDDDSRISSSYRSRFGSLDDHHISSSPTHDKVHGRSKAARNAPFSPALQAKDTSTAGLMFDMEDEAGMILEDPISTRSKLYDWSAGKTSNIGAPIPSKDVSQTSKVKLVEEQISPITSPNGFRSPHSGTGPPVQNGKTWQARKLSSTKLDMKEIMAQASSSRPSNLSMGFSAQKGTEKATFSVHKISQKERKKQQQQALQQAISQSQAKSSPTVKASSPWQVQTASKMSLKDVIDSEAQNSSPPVSEAKRLPVPATFNIVRRTASPDTRFAGQSRNTKKSLPRPSAAPSKSSPQPNTGSTTLVPHSKSYKTQLTNAEPALLLSMSDIIGQQKREQDLIKEAVAKRSLQEIQEEQAFQAWWDAESRRAQEDEAERARKVAAAEAKKEKGKKPRGGSRGGGGGGAGRGDGAQRGSERGGRGRGAAQTSAS